MFERPTQPGITRSGVARLHRAVASSGMILFAFATFSLCVWLLPIEQRTGSTVGRWLHDTLWGRARISPRSEPGAELGFDATGACFVERSGWGETPESNRISRLTLYVVLRSEPYYQGWWAFTEIDEGPAIAFPLGTASSTNGELQQVRTVFLTWLDSLNDPHYSSLAQQLASGDKRTTRTLWLGWLHNAVSLAAACVFLLSVPLFLHRKWREHAEWKRTQLSRCASCSYNLTGLPHNAICPECGRPRTSWHQDR